MKQVLKQYARLVMTAAGLFLLLWLGVGMMQPAAPAYAELPPRPEPTAVPDKKPVSGAQIKLVVETAVSHAWTTIQWQDPYTGEWTTVDGWQGTVAADGTQVWWVGSEHFGEGPFRWLLYDEEGGTLLDMSAAFDMPTYNKQVLTVTIPAPSTAE